jgi:hypothetical protein
MNSQLIYHIAAFYRNAAKSYTVVWLVTWLCEPNLDRAVVDEPGFFHGQCQDMRPNVIR